MHDPDETYYVGEFITEQGPVSIYLRAKYLNSDGVSLSDRKVNLEQAGKELIERINGSY